MSEREAACAAFRQMVDEGLRELHRPGMTAATLYVAYTMFSDATVMMPLNPQFEFSECDYARHRAVEICAAPQMKES